MALLAVLGGEPRPIPTCVTGGYYRPGAPDTVYAEDIAGFVQAGYRAVKLKTGAASPADEARRVRTVREAIGKDISLMLDMNAPYDVTAASRGGYAGTAPPIVVRCIKRRWGMS